MTSKGANWIGTWMIKDVYFCHILNRCIMEDRNNAQGVSIGNSASNVMFYLIGVATLA